MSNLEELKQRNKKIVQRFEKLEPKRWSIEGATMELATEVGDLTELVLRKEYFKQNIYDDIDYQIQDELADILFVLLRIADYYGIDLDKAYLEMERLISDRLRSRGV